METILNLATDILDFLESDVYYFDVAENLYDIKKSIRYYLDRNDEEGLKMCFHDFLILPEIESPENCFFDTLQIQQLMEIKDRIRNLSEGS